MSDELWQCNVCGETFGDTGARACPFCGSTDVEECEDEPVEWVGDEPPEPDQ